MTNSTVSGNSANNAAGIYNSGTTATVNLNFSTVASNTATTNGGGLFQDTTGTTNLKNSIVGDNTAATGPDIFGTITSQNYNHVENVSGGTFFADPGQTPHLNFSAAASNNAAAKSGGLFQDTNETTKLKNSIVGDNLAVVESDIFGTTTSQDDYYHFENLSGETFFADLGQNQKVIDTSFLALANDVTGTDPQLAGLANNGGTTLTHLPGSMSPVVNTIPNGTNDCGTVITTSQNAVSRPQQSLCEKGSAERLAPSAANATVGGRVSNGRRGIAGAIVQMQDLNGSIRTARTNSFGYFTFEDVQVGETYVFTIRSKGYIFETQVLNILDNLTELKFTANP